MPYPRLYMPNFNQREHELDLANVNFPQVLSNFQSNLKFEEDELKMLSNQSFEEIKLFLRQNNRLAKIKSSILNQIFAEDKSYDDIFAYSIIHNKNIDILKWLLSLEEFNRMTVLDAYHKIKNYILYLDNDIIGWLKRLRIPQDYEELIKFEQSENAQLMGIVMKRYN